MTDDDLLASATEALRELPVDADGAATRLRVRRSLEADHRGRRQLVSFLTATGILFAGTMSWAFATGRAAAVWHAIVDPAPVREVSPPPPPAPPPAARGAITRAPAPVVAPEPAPEAPNPMRIETRVETAAPPKAEPIARAPAPVLPAPPPAPAPPPGPIEALYRRAHELHFHGRDHGAAIAAWDAYLAAEPTGRFVAEARYNRALLLIRVGRYAEALAALEPYARGEVEGGYRREAAAKLVERLVDRAGSGSRD